MGLNQAQSLAHELIEEALAILVRTRLQTSYLEVLARLVVERDH